MENIMDSFGPTDVALLGIVIVLFVITWLMLWRAMKELRLAVIMTNKKDGNQAVNLRLQACERLVLLVERIKPFNLLGRMPTSGLGAQELHREMIQSVRGEFNHNLTQQIYVSEQSWQMVHRLVEQSIAIVNTEAGKLSLSAKGTELAKNILERISGLNDDPYQLVAVVLREEAQNLLDKQN